MKNMRQQEPEIFRLFVVRKSSTIKEKERCATSSLSLVSEQTKQDLESYLTLVIIVKLALLNAQLLCFETDEKYKTRTHATFAKTANGRPLGSKAC